MPIEEENKSGDKGPPVEAFVITDWTAV
jgi:hypothetical protein